MAESSCGSLFASIVTENKSRGNGQFLCLALPMKIFNLTIPRSLLRGIVKLKISTELRLVEKQARKEIGKVIADSSLYFPAIFQKACREDIDLKNLDIEQSFILSKTHFEAHFPECSERLGA